MSKPSAGDLLPALVERYRTHPGRGGCGVGAVVDLRGRASHELIDWALRGLSCMEHRGGAIGDTGDGAGLLLRADRAFFSRFIAPGRRLPEEHQLCVGVLFLTPGPKGNLPHWQREIDGLLRRHGLSPLGWRRVPVDEGALGRQALEARREVWQVLAGEGMVAPEDLPLCLYRLKLEMEERVRELYVASFSPATVVYKALATSEQLRRFYRDLSDPDLRTDALVFHRRYSTNTFSNWYLAQVFRTLGHNGEINTIKANRNSVMNLEAELGLSGILMPQGSDSADMDRVVELFVSHGVSLPETLCRLMPPAFRELHGLPEEARRYFQGVQRALGTLGAWEGPAAIVATDGRHLVGALDRMGLRPMRWLRTRQGRLILGSELGAIPVPFEDVEETGQLDPGEAIAVDLAERSILRPRELVSAVVAHTPINFAELAERRLIRLERSPSPAAPKPSSVALNLFGWTLSRIRTVEHMAKTGKEPITSMGNDRPLPVFSAQRPPLSKYFKQIVAVVTNPPIDPIREEGAFDLSVHLGASPTVRENAPVYNPLPQYRLDSPFLTSGQLEQLLAADAEDRPRAHLLDATFADPGGDLDAGAKAISRRISELVREGVGRVRRGESSILVLSDRLVLGEQGRLPLPMVLLTSALHNALVEEGRRRHASIVVESGEVQEGHDAAVLIANGASAIYPSLFLAVGAAQGPESNLLHALEETLKRVMSKMGICSVDGYRGSRLFEAVGLHPSLVEHYLPGITARVGGVELEDLYDDLHARALAGGQAQREIEVSVYRKEVWQELQTVARGHDPEAYRRFLDLIAETPPVYLRDLLQLSTSARPAPLEEVDAEEEIVRACFRGAAMSLGALHRTAHQAIAAAFNAFGAASNCGEGGEDPRRDPGGPLAEARSRIRQVASGRFGVEARYLVHADELSIKIGQGAKPGEGGMLPAAKVTEEIARIRRTQPNVALISPPPHHDIYSIEDLAQLIYNLRQVNPRARISVKVPGVTDIGTIAVGIAKAGADVIDVSGFEGGTGAAASSSIEHAGLPLERALSETHQALVVNGVRQRVRLRADGGIKTGFDVVAVLALGADEVSLGTSLMIAEQCIFCHGCANGMCPAGITTQSDLVARRLMTEKKGRPRDALLPEEESERYADAEEAVKRYLRALARDVREKMAALGVRRVSDLVGRTDLLDRRSLDHFPERTLRRASKVDLSELLVDFTGGARPDAAPAATLPVLPTSDLNARLCEEAHLRPVMVHPVSSTDRAVGATLAGAIAAGRIRVPAGGFALKLEGYAGQGLAFACVDGMRVELTGFCNDAAAEVMSGGTLVLRAPRAVAQEARGGLSVAGNALGYGATGGRILVEGRAGQRVGVRNSGATIVVEGCGKYAFEYMTGGVGAVLGPSGAVIGSGLTGGQLFLWDDGTLEARLHPDARRVPLGLEEADQLRALLEEHARETGSFRARSLLSGFQENLDRFALVVPAEQAKALARTPPRPIERVVGVMAGPLASGA